MVNLNNNDKKKDAPIFMPTRLMPAFERPYSDGVECAFSPDTIQLPAGDRARLT